MRIGVFAPVSVFSSLTVSYYFIVKQLFELFDYADIVYNLLNLLSAVLNTSLLLIKIHISNNSIKTDTTNNNLNISKLWPLNRGYSVLIKSSKSPENKGFIAMCSPYLFIRLHTSLLFPSLLIRANTRARKSHNKNKHKCGNRRTVMYVRIYYNGGFFNGQVYLRW